MGGRSQRTNPTGARSPADLGPVARAPFRAHGAADGRQCVGSRRQAVRTGTCGGCGPVLADRALVSRPRPARADSAGPGATRGRWRRGDRLVRAVARWRVRGDRSQRRRHRTEHAVGDRCRHRLAARGLDPVHAGVVDRLAARQHRFLVHALPAGEPVRPACVLPPRRHRLDRGSGGVRRAAHSGDLARCDRQRRRQVPARLHAGRLEPDRCRRCSTPRLANGAT